MFELKTSANTNRAKEALHAANGALDYGVQRYLLDEAWAGSETFQINGASVSVSATTSSGFASVVAEGESLDGTGHAKVREQYGSVPVFDPGKIPPVMANGTFDPNGNFTIIGNPNGAGDPNNPNNNTYLSAWTADTPVAGGTGSWQTCNVTEYLNSKATNAASAYSYYGGGEFIACESCSCTAAVAECTGDEFRTYLQCDDIIEGNTTDTFANTFNLLDVDGNPDPGAWQRIKSYAEPMTCAQIDGADVGAIFYGGARDGDFPIIWVDGDCTINGGTIASYDEPVIVVIHGDVTLSGNFRLWGIVFAFSDIYTETWGDPHPNDSPSTVLSVNGTGVVYGSLLTNGDVDLGAGTYTLYYSKSVLDNIGAGTSVLEIARKQGSWSDFDN
ncbi:hypothetical protein GCM10011348_43300 [Marinobacterium nitratireducens]|uniref:Uncharacterized protein n=2 Tax=Marinobacterium nitratireducens TaxID=518897 RepID=A0A917ZPT1_9GAMM|nr:hypothetical protein GCM10011348_43300 [Marinobacterium nitratireducens]